MFDCSRDLSEREAAYAKRLLRDAKAIEKPAMAVLNKIDLKEPDEGFLARLGRLADGQLSVEISAKTGEGLDKLKSLLVDIALKGKRMPSETGITVTNARHYSALVKSKESLDLALQSLSVRQTGEFVVVDLRSALDSLGTITGVVTTDDILNSIFARFCIGK
jgi:tRNA U34 5-carboxymethylaminomethyl modifying GTPase MnmE/TrmE